MLVGVGLNKAGASVTPAAVLAAMIGQTVTAAGFVTTGADGQFLLKFGPNQNGFFQGSSSTAVNLETGGSTNQSWGPGTVSSFAGTVTSLVASPGDALVLTAGARINIGGGRFYGDGSGRPTWDSTTHANVYANFSDGSGTTGNQTINVVRGICAIAAAANACTITNNEILSSTSLVIPVILNVDATAKSVVAAPSAGSVTFTLNANATGTVKIGFLVFN